MGAKRDPDLDDDIENEVDISMYGKEVRMQESSGGSNLMAIYFPRCLPGGPLPL